MNVSRREFCATLAALGAGQILSAGEAGAQSARARSETGARRVDTHHHILPPEYVTTVGEGAIGAPAPNRLVPKWSVASSLEAMDRNAIATAVVSVSAPGIWFNDARQAKRLARSCNEYAAQMAADYPGRFGTFAALPLPDVQAGLEEIRHAFDVLRSDGIGLMTNYGDRYLGDAEFAPIFDELNRRKAVVYVHPTACGCSAGILPEQPASLIEFTHDTTRTITSLLFSGAFSRCPEIRFIFSHAGGTVPFLANRIAVLGSIDKSLAAKVPEGVMPTLKRLYYDTALSANPITFAALLKLVSPKNVLLGTDFPFAPEAAMRATLAGIRQQGLDDNELRAIEGENALALFPRLVPAAKG